MLVFLFLHMLSFTCIFKSQAQRSWVRPCTLSSLSHRATGFTHCLFLLWAVTKEVPVLLVFPKASEWPIATHEHVFGFITLGLLRCVNWYSHPRVSLPIDAVVNFDKMLLLKCFNMTVGLSVSSPICHIFAFSVFCRKVKGCYMSLVHYAFHKYKIYKVLLFSHLMYLPMNCFDINIKIHGLTIELDMTW